MLGTPPLHSGDFDQVAFGLRGGGQLLPELALVQRGGPVMDHLSVLVLPWRAQNNHVVLPPGGLLMDRTRLLKLAQHVGNLLMWSVFAAYPVQRLVDAVQERPLAKMDS